MNVSLPYSLQEFVTNQVKSGQFENVNDVLREALRLLRDEQETKAMKEMRAAFAGVDSSRRKAEPTAKDRALINKLIKRHRRSKNGR